MVKNEQELMNYFDDQFSLLQRNLNKFPRIANMLDLSTIKSSVVFAVNSIAPNDVELKSRLPKMKHADANQFESYKPMDEALFPKISGLDHDTRLEWEKFKKQYILWGQNLIVTLNKAKNNCVPWLDVKRVAHILSKLELE